MRIANAALVSLFALAALLAPRAGVAQTTLLVAPGDILDIDPQAGADLVEESAWIAGDAGFAVTRYYDADAAIAPGMSERLASCGAVASCYSSALSGSAIEGVLIVSVVGSGGDWVVHYEVVHIGRAMWVGDSYATLATTTDFPALVAPCNEALALLQSAPLVPAPAPVPPQQATHPPLPPTQSAPAQSAPAQPAPAQQGPIQPAARAAASVAPLQRAGRITAATGGGFLFLGVLAGFYADDAQQELQARPHPADEVKRLQDQGRSRQQMANVSFAIGGVAVATGVTLLVVERLGRDEGRVSIAPGSVRVAF